MTRTWRWRIIMALWLAIGIGLARLELPALVPGLDEIRVVAWVVLGLVGMIGARGALVRIWVAAGAVVLLAERIIPLVVSAWVSPDGRGGFSALMWIMAGTSVIFAAIPARTEAR